MLNGWDLGFVLLLLPAAWIGWRIKSLPLAGLCAGLWFAPQAALAWHDRAAGLMLRWSGQPHPEGAWWAAFLAAFLAICLFFWLFSRILAALNLEALDQLLGALLALSLALALLSLNLLWIERSLKLEADSGIRSSWTWGRLSPEDPPAWARQIGETALKIASKIPGRSPRTT